MTAVISKLKHTSLALIIASFATSAHACDLCAVYASIESRELHPGAFHLSLWEQYTDLDDVRVNGEKVENPAGERMRSSTTQVVPSYDVSSNFAVQMNLPLIYRSYHRLEEGVKENGDVSGLGDIALLARIRPYRWDGVESLVRVELFGGVKLPTGDSDRLQEEIGEDHHDEGEEHSEPHSGVFVHHADSPHESDDEHVEGSAVHGHDLVLGSGSVDFPFGAAFFGRYGRAVANAGAQYTFRSTGRYDYRFGDDFLWRTGIGAYLLLSEERSMILRASLSGEYKDEDTREGESFGDTYMRAMYAGPELLVSFGHSFSGEFGWDIPFDIDNHEKMVTPSNRFRLGMTMRF